MARDFGDASELSEVTSDYLVRIVDNPNSEYPVDKLIPGTDMGSASAISVLDTGNYFTGTNVETVLAELPGKFRPLDAVTAIPTIAPTRTGDVTLSAGYAYGTRYPVDVAMVARRAVLRVSGQTGTLDVGVYDASYDKILSSGAVQVAPAGAMEVALPPLEIPAEPASLWMSVSGASGFAASATQGDLTMSEEIATGAYPLPATLTGVVRSSNFVAMRVLPADPTPLSVAYVRTTTNYSVLGKIGTRLYARNTTNDKFAYSDDSGDTWVDSATSFTSVFGASACLEIVGYTTYMFAVLEDGRLMRANLDAFSTWADKSVAGQPASTTGRVGVLASYSGATPRLFYTNYHRDNTDIPGAFVWRSGSAGDTWSSATLAAGARHGHAVAVDPVTPTTIWCTVGDSSPERGLYKSTDNGVTWAQTNTNTRYGIDITFAYSLTGAPNRVILEGDGNAGSPHMMSYLSALSTGLTDPVVWPDTAPSDGLGSWSGTGRAAIVTSEGNLVYATTGELGAVGSREGLWIAKGPWFTSPILLEEWAQGSQPAWRRTYESGSYLFNGIHKITRPKFAGQT